jgi:putative transposase
MSRYSKGSHTVLQCHYHFVFIPKFRKPVLRGGDRASGPGADTEICRGHDIEIIKGHVRPGHVHLLLSVPPTMAPSRVMLAIKGKTSHNLLQDFRALRQAF